MGYPQSHFFCFFILALLQAKFPECMHNASLASPLWNFLEYRHSYPYPFPKRTFMKRLCLLFIALFISHATLAQSNRCPEHFSGGAAPQFINQKLAARTAALCFEAFAVMHSGISRTPIWSAEHLTANSVDNAKTIKRRNVFHSEDRLPPADRADLRDYAGSGLDRGHMSPSGDMPTREAQYESFSLANIVPQDPNNNQNLWVGFEEGVRTLARSRGELYVITGPLFEGNSIQRLNGRVLVPTHLFKAVYDPVSQQAAAYVAPNVAGNEYQIVSIAELEKRININLFPKMPASVKVTKMALPEPRPHGRRLRQPRF
jgi:endonuclease G